MVTQINTFEADGTLGTRRLRLLRLLGSGLGGMVFLAEDPATGVLFVEKHYGAVPAHGAKQLGRQLAETFLLVSREAPPSYRVRPEAAIAAHLTNRFVVACAGRRGLRPFTLPVLYTRYDEQTGGYVHAFPYVQGRPLQPWSASLPLFGEAALFAETMRAWRDFMADELGFWGIARQVDPRNFNSYSNLWITPDHHVLLLDIVPGIPGFEPPYLWRGLMRGEFPPFGDAMEFARLETFLRAHPLEPAETWANDLELFRTAVQQWQASEPRLWSSPVRWWHVLADPEIRGATRAGLVTHLEVKGAIAPGQAAGYRQRLAQTGRFPKLIRHHVLSTMPLPLHRFLTDGRYAWRSLLGSWRLPLKAWRVAVDGARAAMALSRQWATFTWRLWTSRSFRIETVQQLLGHWIEESQQLGRLRPDEAMRLQQTIKAGDREVADLTGLFALHVTLRAVKPLGFTPTSLVFLTTAVVTGNWWWGLPILVDPLLRVAATLWIGRGRYGRTLLLSALPVVGLLSAPLSLLRQQPEVGGFMVRAMAQEAASRVPGFGERGARLEMLAVAAVQTLIVDPAPWLAPVLLAASIGAVLHWPWLVGVAAATYSGAVLTSVVRRWRPSGPSALPRWRFGLPDRYLTFSLSPADKPPLETVTTSGTPGGHQTGLEEPTKPERSGLLRVVLDRMPVPVGDESLTVWSQRIRAPQGPGLVSPVEDAARRLRTLLRDYSFAQQTALWAAFLRAIPSVVDDPYRVTWLTDTLESAATLHEMQGPPSAEPIQQALTLLRTASSSASPSTHPPSADSLRTGLEEPTKPPWWEWPMVRRTFLKDTARTIAALAQLGGKFGALAELFASRVETPAVPPWDPYRSTLRQLAESRIGLTTYDTGRIWVLAREDETLRQMLSGNPLEWGLGMQRLHQILEEGFQRAQVLERQLTTAEGRVSLAQTLRRQKPSEFSPLADEQLTDGFSWAVGERLRIGQSSLAQLDVEMKQYWALVVQRVQAAAAARYGRELSTETSTRPLILGTRQPVPEVLERLWQQGVTLTEEQIVAMVNAQAAGANDILLLEQPSAAAGTTITLYPVGELQPLLTQQVAQWPAWPSAEAAVRFDVQTLSSELAPHLAVAVRLASQPRVEGMPNLVIHSPEELDRVTAALVATVAHAALPPADQDLPVIAVLPLTVDGRDLLTLFL